MLRFQEPLTPAAKYLLVYSLVGAEDELADFEVDDWEAQFPRSAACFSRELARTTMADLRGKLELPELYQPTDYHWLLIYEGLRLYFAILNDYQIAEVNQQLLALASKGDSYLQFRRKRRPSLHVTIDFDRFIDQFFWDTDFLESAAVYEQLDPRAKQSLGANPKTFGVIQGLAPHPDELRLEVCSEGEETSE
jgi:hypothetical protein